MIITGDVIKVTTEIEDRDMMGKIYKVENTSMAGSIEVMYEGDTVRLYKGEFITLEEEEAMIELFTQLTGKEPEYVSKLEDAQDEIKALETTIKELNDHMDELREDGIGC